MLLLTVDITVESWKFGASCNVRHAIFPIYSVAAIMKFLATHFSLWRNWLIYSRLPKFIKSAVFIVCLFVWFLNKKLWIDKSNLGLLQNIKKMLFSQTNWFVCLVWPNRRNKFRKEIYDKFIESESVSDGVSGWKHTLPLHAPIKGWKRITTVWKNSSRCSRGNTPKIRPTIISFYSVLTADANIVLRQAKACINR
jgi:hypothetical protein